MGQHLVYAVLDALFVTALQSRLQLPGFPVARDDLFHFPVCVIGAHGIPGFFVLGLLREQLHSRVSGDVTILQSVQDFLFITSIVGFHFQIRIQDSGGVVPQGDNLPRRRCQRDSTKATDRAQSLVDLPVCGHIPVIGHACRLVQLPDSQFNRLFPDVPCLFQIMEGCKIHPVNRIPAKNGSDIFEKRDFVGNPNVAYQIPVPSPERLPELTQVAFIVVIIPKCVSQGFHDCSGQRRYRIGREGANHSFPGVSFFQVRAGTLRVSEIQVGIHNQVVAQSRL